MNTQFLRFPDESTARSVMSDYLSSGQWITATHQYSLDPIGVLKNGFLVNFVGSLPSGAAQYVVAPMSASRIFAGDSWGQLWPTSPQPLPPSGVVNAGEQYTSGGKTWWVIQTFSRSTYGAAPNTYPALLRVMRSPTPATWVQPIDQFDSYRMVNAFSGQPDQCIYNGATYTTLVDYNVWTPGSDATLWATTAPPADVWPVWVQPYGGSGTYVIGSQVTYKSKHYKSIYNGLNVWAPDAYPAGWSLQP